jgi:hypothetical protein
VLRFAFALFAAAAANYCAGCTCVGEAPLDDTLRGSSLVFLGTVTHVDEFPQNPRMRGRKRYAATMRIDRSWKGDSRNTITLYYLDPGTDSQGEDYVIQKNIWCLRLSESVEM